MWRINTSALIQYTLTVHRLNIWHGRLDMSKVNIKKQILTMNRFCFKRHYVLLILRKPAEDEYDWWRWKRHLTVCVSVCLQCARTRDRKMERKGEGDREWCTLISLPSPQQQQINRSVKGSCAAGGWLTWLTPKELHTLTHKRMQKPTCICFFAFFTCANIHNCII